MSPRKTHSLRPRGPCAVPCLASLLNRSRCVSSILAPSVRCPMVRAEASRNVSTSSATSAGTVRHATTSRASSATSWNAVSCYHICAFVTVVFRNYKKGIFQKTRNKHPGSRTAETNSHFDKTLRHYCPLISLCP